MIRLETVAVLLSIVGSAGCSGEPVQPVTSAAPEAPVVESAAPETVDVDGAWGLPLRGLFVYMADAAVFELCETGRKLPVAMEADYLSAERAYLESRSEPGALLLVTLVGHVDQRPPMEGDGLVEVLVIDRFDSTHPDEDCSGSRTTESY